jgi:hypothetical protein
MTIQSPHLPQPVPATRESVEATIRLISSKEEDPFAIVSGSDHLTFMQTLVTPVGFHWSIRRDHSPLITRQFGQIFQPKRSLRRYLTMPTAIRGGGIVLIFVAKKSAQFTTAWGTFLAALSAALGVCLRDDDSV